jgi:sulfoquinovosidase
VLAASAEARTVTVTSGDLTARVQTNPWHVTFLDRGGHVLLSESAGRSGRHPGALGVRTAAGWTHARRAISVQRVGAGYTFVVTTSGHGKLLVRLAASSRGSIELEVSSAGGAVPLGTGIGFGAKPRERFLGFGERATHTDQRGSTVESYVADGPYQPNEFSLVKNLIPALGLRNRSDATYYPVPWLLSTRGYGVLAEGTSTTYHRLGSDVRGEWSVETENPLRLRVFGGGTPARVLQRFSSATGRQPAPAAPWVFGAWYQPSGTTAEQVAQVHALRAAGSPLSLAQTYTHYLPCGDQRSQQDAERARVAALHAAGVAVTTYVNPMICTTYDPPFGRLAATGGLTKHVDGSPYVYKYTTSHAFDVGQFDFTSAVGRAGFDSILRDAVADGHDGWMEDFGEYTPLDALASNNTTGSGAHNRYPVDYHCAANAFVAGRPIVRFQRSGWTGAARCASVVWGGDPTTSWGFDGLQSAVRAALSLGLSGVSRWGSDIGGFFSLFNERLTPELLTRWVQFGAVSPVMRTERDGIAVPAKQRPQVDDPGQIGNWARWSAFHTQLYPYLSAADAAYRRTGMPTMRQLALAYPGDARANGRDDEFLFGPDLLAAPVLRDGARKRSLYLPRGEWIDLWRSARFDPRAGVALDRVKRVRGGRSVTVPAPLDELPLMVRAGGLIPMLDPAVQTLTGYGQGVVHLADRRYDLRLIAFPSGASRATFDTDGSLTSSLTARGWSLRLRARHTRAVQLQASLPFRPCAMTLGGHALARSAWSYDRRSGVLHASFRTRAGELVARRSC